MGRQLLTSSALFGLIVMMSFLITLCVYAYEWRRGGLDTEGRVRKKQVGLKFLPAGIALTSVESPRPRAKYSQWPVTMGPGLLRHQ